jgi:trehalose 6-phosphate synthase
VGVHGSAPLVVVTDRPPHDPGTGTVAPGSGLPDEPALVALQAVAARARGVWVCRAGEVEPTVPLRRRLVDPPEAALHDAAHATSLWSLYHDAVPARYDPAWRLAIRAVSNAHAGAAALEAAFGATVWVYGHTLQLVPAILRRRRPDLRIGFYLPTHFPATEGLRAMPMHRELLRGLLGADLLGFQTAVATENFLRRTQELTERPPSVGVFPTSAQTPAIAALAGTPAVATAAAALRRRLGDPRTVILSVDPPEPGVRARLLDLGEAFADGRLDPRDTVVLQVLLGRPGDGDSPGVDTNAVDADAGIARAVAYVNGHVGRTVIHSIVDTPALADRVVYYRAADVLLATPRREGATTVALEFAAAAGDDAALVLSELSGSATVLPDAYLVDARQPDRTLTVLAAALPGGRRPAAAQPAPRMARMRAAVTAYHTYGWAEAFLRTLRATPRYEPQPAPVPAAVPARHPVGTRQRVRLGG